MLSSNCETFATYCKSGNAVSVQANDFGFVKKGLAAAAVTAGLAVPLGAVTAALAVPVGIAVFKSGKFLSNDEEATIGGPGGKFCLRCIF
jgi:hypothetical protein